MFKDFPILTEQFYSREDVREHYDCQRNIRVELKTVSEECAVIYVFNPDYPTAMSVSFSLNEGDCIIRKTESPDGIEFPRYHQYFDIYGYTGLLVDRKGNVYVRNENANARKSDKMWQLTDCNAYISNGEVYIKYYGGIYPTRKSAHKIPVIKKLLDRKAQELSNKTDFGNFNLKGFAKVVADTVKEQNFISNKQAAIIAKCILEEELNSKI